MDRFATIVSADAVCAFFMTVVLVGMTMEKNRAKSTNALIKIFLVNILCSLADLCTYILSGSQMPVALIYVCYLLSYCGGTISLILFLRYWHFYISERDKLNKWFRIIPVIALTAVLGYTLICFALGQIFVIKDGNPVITGGMPLAVTIVQLFFIVYLPVVALSKSRNIGLSSVLCLGTFGVFPFLTALAYVIFGIYDFSYPASALSLVMIYVLLQNRQSLEIETEQHKFLAYKTEQLYIQLEEIATLNTQLKENQQIRDSQYAVLESMSEIFYSLHVIDLENDSVQEYNAKNEVKLIVNRKKGARQMMIQIISAVTDEENRDEALAFTDLTTVAERLGNKKIISKQLIGKNTGWFLASFISMETDKSGKCTKVIFTTRVIDEEKRKQEILLLESQTDELTGLLNRRAYEETIYKHNSISSDENFIYMSLDVNGLKVINDTKGHMAGDELIVGSCQCMKQSLGPYGKIYRTGGDEFVAILFCPDEKIQSICEDFDNAIASWTGKHVESLSISYGWISKQEMPQASVRELGIIAEERMYDAKSAHYKKTGVDRRGQIDAHKALCNLYTKILKINLTEDSYQIINMDISEQTTEKGFSDKISQWLYSFGKSGQVHNEDLEEYLKLTDLQYMKDYFESEKTSLHIFYRRKIQESFKQFMMEIIPADDYSHDNQSLYLYVLNIDK